MNLQINKINLQLAPEVQKVIPRFFNPGNERSLILINRVLQMKQENAKELLFQVCDEFSRHHKDLQGAFEKHFALVKHLFQQDGELKISREQKLLIGAYFTMEYSLQHAALFNPSIVEDPDQSGAEPGEKNVILSFRAIGEGHISSLVFKRGKLNKDSMIHFETSGPFMNEGHITQQKLNSKADFEILLSQTSLPAAIREDILSQLQHSFSYPVIESILKTALQKVKPGTGRNKLKYDILSMVNSSYETHFSPSSQLSERVIFPVTFTEKNGIEDARFVKFTDDYGATRYIATYTAYDGTFILPHLIETKDFLHFKFSPLHGKTAINKNLALFPKKINGEYVMLSRIDGINNYIMYSDDLYLWENATLIQQPKYPWEFVQIGNGGAALETDRGWLVITHGVGPMRKYCLGASLFELNDPSKEIGRLKEPILIPEESERHGYVPNVVYTCGALIHNDNVFIPYAISDYKTSFVTIQLKGLLDAIMQSHQ